MTVEIVEARTAAELVQVAELAREFLEWTRVRYAEEAWIVDAYYDPAAWEAELAGLERAYGPPGGAILLARVDGAPAGCVMMRPLRSGIGELKRLFVREAFQGAGIGRALCERLIALARQRGHSRLRLDTGFRQPESLRLYERLGFQRIPAYYDCPEPMRANLIFMELELMADADMATTRMPDGDAVPILGQGTWFMGEGRRPASEEADALRLGLDLGMTLIDTAEMYGDGGAERVVGEAIAGRRDGVYLVSKVLPYNASREGTVAACEASLKRLGIDRIDLYLLHWPGSHPLAGTIEAFEALRAGGKIRHWGVSNFDVDEIVGLVSLGGGDAVQTNQVLYNPMRRGIEFDLLPWCRERRIPIMAYSPIEQGRLLDHKGLRAVAERHAATPAQAALAWVLREGDVIAIPKAATPHHVHENRAALDIRLTDEDLAELDRAFPPPRRKVALQML